MHNGQTPGFVGLQQKFSTCAFFVTSQTRYPSLRSSGVTAALLTVSLGLGPPPRLEAEWTVLKSREAGGLEGRTPDEEEALDASGCSLGSMTVLMTGGKKKMQYKSIMMIIYDILFVLFIQ